MPSLELVEQSKVIFKLKGKILKYHMRQKELGAKSEKNIKNGNELIEGKESFLTNKILTS